MLASVVIGNCSEKEFESFESAVASYLFYGGENSSEYLEVKEVIDTAHEKQLDANTLPRVLMLVSGMSGAVGTLMYLEEERKISPGMDSFERSLRYLNLIQGVFKTDWKEKEIAKIVIQKILNESLYVDNFEVEEFVLNNIGFENIFEKGSTTYREYMDCVMKKFDEKEKKTVERNVREIKKHGVNDEDLVANANKCIQEKFEYSPEGMFNRLSFLTLRSLLSKSDKAFAYVYWTAFDKIIKPAFREETGKVRRYIEKCEMVLDLMKPAVRRKTLVFQESFFKELCFGLLNEIPHFGDGFVLERMIFGEKDLNLKPEDIFVETSRKKREESRLRYIRKLRGKINTYLHEEVKDHPENGSDIEKLREDGMFRELDWYYMPRSTKVREMFQR